MVFLLIFTKMTPKSILGIVYFPHFSAPVPQGVFWKVPCLILAPFCLHFGRFWHPFGSTWVASGTFNFRQFCFNAILFWHPRAQSTRFRSSTSRKNEGNFIEQPLLCAASLHPTQSGTLPLATWINRPALTGQFRHLLAPFWSLLTPFWV